MDCAPTLKHIAARRFRQQVVVAMAFTVLVAAPVSRGTSIVAKLDKRQIILAGDTRVGSSSEDSGAHTSHDDACKLLALGKIGVGIGGSLDYRRTDLSDPIEDWSSISDARTAYQLHLDDVRAIATEWVQRAALHYTIFYRLASGRVRQLANANSDHVLVGAFFVGWERDVPLLIWKKVFLDEPTAYPIKVSEQVLPPRSLPYATDAITQELIEGNSPRTEAAASEWNKVKQKFRRREIDWRQVAFFVTKTAQYDESVSPRADVLVIPVGGPAEWAQNVTCQRGKSE